ncbi:MAG: MarR family transcriptional regulator [Acidimicrobiia bacterium]
MGRAETTPMTEMELADELRLVIGRLARRLRQHAVGGLTPSQRSVLATLNQSGVLRMGDLARIEDVSPPSITGIIGRLEEKGMVTRIPDPDDARSTMVQISDEATRLLEESRKARSTYLATQLSSLDADERARLETAVRILDRMIDE